jgi:hypothetical protein
LEWQISLVRRGIIVLRRIFGLMLVGALLNLMVGVSSVVGKVAKEAQPPEEIRATIARLGIGQDVKAEVTLVDNTKLKGYVTEANTDTFVITDAKTGASRTIAYTEVSQVSKSGKGFSTRTKVLIGAGIAAGAIVGWLILKPALCDGGAQHRGPC